MKPIDLKQVITHFDRVIAQVRDLDIGDRSEADRVAVIESLEGARDVVRALCLSGKPDGDFPCLASLMD